MRFISPWTITIMIFLIFPIYGALGQSHSFFDNSSGITFQRVVNKYGASFAVALPPRGDHVSEFIVQMSGSLSYGFAGLSTDTNLQGLVLNTWCCAANLDSFNAFVEGTTSLEMIVSPRVLVGSTLESSNIPIITTVAPSEITNTNWKITFRCQNCVNIPGLRGVDPASHNSLFSTVYSDIKPTNVSDAALEFSSSDVKAISFDLAAASIANYWSFVGKS
ncbi:hypothetical protein K439DRAFT_1636713 [Ramaria rubella]|nr:hypothetical protein K439DRAFT_1636713 [Ramaria rubella]